MQFNFSEMKKFSTWRRLWLYLATAEKVCELARPCQTSRCSSLIPRPSEVGRVPGNEANYDAPCVGVIILNAS